MLPAIGGHGAEIRLLPEEPGEIIRFSPLSDDVRAAARRLVAVDHRLLLEDKGYSLAVHYRAAPDLESYVLAGLEILATTDAQPPLDVLHGKYVAELKSRGTDKGAALRVLLKHPPFLGRVPVFLGDDVTDEYALEVLPDFGGIGIAVGQSLKGADYHFPGPVAVRAWLAAVAQQACGT
jgi:trehalose 6-phosphate phosphatase